MRISRGWPAAAGLAALALTLTACGSAAASSSAPPATARPATSAPAAPASPAPVSGGTVDPGPVPTGPDTTGLAPGAPGNWSQDQWEQYWSDLGLTAADASADDTGACYANAVALAVSSADADAVAKAFPPGTSGKSETDYISALEAQGMDANDATVDVSEVQAAQENTSC